MTKRMTPEEALATVELSDDGAQRNIGRLLRVSPSSQPPP
jgi:hypothetical protein